MSDLAIRFEDVSKQYRLGMIGTGTISHDLNRWWTTRVRGKEDPYMKIGSVNSRSLKVESSYFWALKDINLEVRQGEVLGIIGRNGAGKSTLLKLLSRVTTPTTGIIKVRGRIASLLEVGTGFHPEMTGRENVYMNGSIMGMNKAEIKRKFDEIVDFAGVEKYIDTPVKRYSSGMTVRLGFAIAAHLEPEILVVDEVLAVGDAEFQKKAVGKMQDVSKTGGRTVLFVSHQMNSISSLCNTCLLLKNGKIHLLDETKIVITEYLKVDQDRSHEWIKSSNYINNSFFTPLKMALVDSNIKVQNVVSNDSKFGIMVESVIETISPYLVIGIALYTSDGTLLFWSLNTDENNSEVIAYKEGVNSFIIWIPQHLLNEGEYRVELMAALHFKEWIIQPGTNGPTISFSIKGGLSQSPNWQVARPGLIAPILRYNPL